MHDAFILAAGFGTRLRPLTDDRPKPLVPVCGVPMLSYSLALCAQHGLFDVVVNAHYLSEQVEALAGEREGVRVHVSVERPEILGTGGGLKLVADQLSDRFVVLNGDTLCTVDLTALRDVIPAGGGVMALRPHLADATERYGVVETDAHDVVTDLKHLATASPTPPVRRDCHFTGIHAMDRRALDLVPAGFACVVRTAYIALVPERRVAAIYHQGPWLDVGDPAAYLDTNLAVLRGQAKLALDPFERAMGGLRDGLAWGVPAHARLQGHVWIGGGAIVEGAVKDSVIGEGAVVPRGASLSECVVWEGVQVPEGVWHRQVFHPGGVLAVDEAAPTRV